MSVTNFLCQVRTVNFANKKVRTYPHNRIRGLVSSVTREPSDFNPSSDRNWNNQSDEEVFAAFIAGEIAALGTIYDRYGLLVYRLIYRMLGNSQEAEDLTQEIFLSLQINPKFNPQRGSFYTYLMMLSRSRGIDRLRSQRSQGRFWQDRDKLKDTISQQNTLSPMDIIAFKERTTKIKNALDNLSTKQRQVLELSYFEGLSQSEIAKRLELPLGTVKTHSRRGLLELKKHLHNFH